MRLPPTIRWREWLIALIGLWLTVSPFALGFETHWAIARNAYAAGATLFGFCLITAWRIVDRGESLAHVLMGVWVTLSPFALGYSAARIPTVNDVAVGVAVIVLAIWQLSLKPAKPGPRSDQH